MAINQVGVVGPRSEPAQQQKEKVSDMDRILQGLQMANSAFGIAVDYQNFQKLRSENAALADARKSILQPREVLDAQKQGVTISDVKPTAPGASAMAYRVRQAEGDSPEAFKEVWASYPTKTKEELAQVTVAGPDGKPQIKFVPKEAGITLPAYEKPEKPSEASKNPAKAAFDQVPPENQEVIKDLSKKNANKISIQNQINAVLENWDDLPEDQKIMQGKQLIKTLNSTEGADAVGAEEAKRLAGKLDFAMGNLTNDNPTQFGRDLPGFKEQAQTTANNLGSAVKKNSAEIDRLYGRAPKAETKSPGDMTREDKIKRLQQLNGQK